MATKVSVVIPARNDGSSLNDAVTRVLNQAGVVVDEVVIAVGPSTDGTEAIAADLARADRRVRTIENPSGLTPAGLNAAIAATSSDIVVRVDARSMLPDGYIANAVETMHETGAGNVGAIQRPVGATNVQSAIAAAMRSVFGSGGAAYRGTDQRRKVKTAYLGVFQREALEDVGGFDESFIRNQDAELNVRLRNAGYEVWLDPRLVVDYYPRPTLRTLRSQYWQYGWWRQRTTHQHRAWQLRQLPAPLLVLALLFAFVGAAFLTPWLLVLPAAYVVSMFVVAMAGSGPIAVRPVTAVALMTMHLSWGAGFLASMISSTLNRGGS